MRDPAEPKPKGLALHWRRTRLSLGRRWRKWRLPRGFVRLGKRYGGWWVFAPAIGRAPLLIDCGLGHDISFPAAFLQRFGGRVIGIDPNPAAQRYVREHCPKGMTLRPEAFWVDAGTTLEFHLPRPMDQLPEGADGVSGSLLASHSYTGGTRLSVRTTSLAEVLESAAAAECDVLKLDVEGAEYEVLAALCASGDIRRAHQLLIEFHHHCTDHPLQHTLDAVAAVEASGFRLMHTEDRNDIFLRDDRV